MPHPPVILWFRRDLRVSDHPALLAAVAKGGPVIPVFIRDAAVEGLGAAPKWRLGEGLRALAERLEDRGSRLILRSGDALAELRALIAETGATAVYWSRLYDPQAQTRDTAVKTALKAEGIEARSFGGHLMFEPWDVQTGTGSYYKVFSPMWRAVQGREVPYPQAAPAALPAPDRWPQSETRTDWALGAAMRRGAEVVALHSWSGEAAAQTQLDHFLATGVDAYPVRRDLLDQDGTSSLAEYLALGEMSPHQAWHAALRVGTQGADAFRRQLVWREFAYHLMFHTPHILTDNWKEGWAHFPWSQDAEHPHFRAWCQGRTGVRFVDAAMREMYVTGRMHNRGRMVVASYLTKHLLGHWRLGLKWFEDCLVDWDPANNAMGWQWVAGCGPDAAPYFRIFNPDTQLKKFDATGGYTRKWIAEGTARPSDTALSYFEAIPRSWRLLPTQHYPDPVVSLPEGRAAALAAYEARENHGP